jgi:DNA-binding NarL/FixJ family response regulator
MKTILSLDNSEISNKVLERDIMEYAIKNNEQFSFIATTKPTQAFFQLGKQAIDVLLIDISSEKYDALSILKEIKQLDIRQPKVIAVTILEDHYFRYEALKLKVFRYVYKPYDNKEIHEALDKFFDKNYYAKKVNREDHFINVGDIENPDYIGKSTDAEDKIIVKAFFEKHKQISAKQFLKKYEGWGLNTEELDELEFSLERVLLNILHNNDFQAAIPDIVTMLETYNSFLYTFEEFDELSKVVYAIMILLRDLKLENITNQVMVSRLIVTTLQDLVDWKEGVFSDQNIDDVYYINDVILNSYVQIQDLIS